MSNAADQAGGLILISCPSRRAISRISEAPSSPHWRSPQGTGSMRLSVRPAATQSASTRRRRPIAAAVVSLGR
jgi:hypothetical protein